MLRASSRRRSGGSGTEFASPAHTDHTHYTEPTEDMGAIVDAAAGGASLVPAQKAQMSRGVRVIRGRIA